MSDYYTISQDEVDSTIGKLDYCLSVMVLMSREVKKVEFNPNAQTLKHHAEDMIAAGNKILENIKGK